MLRHIIHWTLQHRLFVILFGLIIAVIGTVTTKKAYVDIFPDLNAPTVVVMTECGDMCAEDVEQLVTYNVESVLGGATSVRHVRSSSSDGLSIVWIEFDWAVKFREARQIVSERLPEVASYMPPEVGMPFMAPATSILGEIMIVGLTADTTTMMNLRSYADFLIRPRLMSLQGVSNVTVLGGDEKEYHIVLNEMKMQYYGVSLSDVLKATENINRNVNGGLYDRNGTEYVIRCVCSTSDLRNLGRMYVCTREDYSVRLTDIADITISPSTPKLGCASIEGESAVLLTVTKTPKSPTIEVTEEIEKILSELKISLPEDVQIRTNIFRSADFIERAINNVSISLRDGIIFVAIVLALFLVNMRTTAITLVTLPLSVLTALFVLEICGFGLNTMSLGGIAIAVGSLVDDAIVDVENVWRRLYFSNKDISTKPKYFKVIEEASCEVRGPILSSTVIILASFLPLFFLTGMEGKMLIPLGVAFVTSLATSTVVALTVTPVLCSYLLRPEKSMGKNQYVQRRSVVSDFLIRKYEVALIKSLQYKKTWLTVSVIGMAFSIVALLNLGTNFLPPFNEGSLTINVSTVPGTPLSLSDEIGIEVEEKLMAVDEVLTVCRKTGRAEKDEHALGSNVSELEVPYELKGRTKEEMLHDIRDRLRTISGVNIEIGQPISHRLDAMLSGTKAAISVKIFGPQLPILVDLSNEVKAVMDEVGGIEDVTAEMMTYRPQLKITPKPEMMAEYGISYGELAKYVNICMSSEQVGVVREDNMQFPIVLRTRRTFSDIGDLMVSTDMGMVPLYCLCKVQEVSSPSLVNRENGTRRIVVSAQQGSKDLETAVKEIKEKIDEEIVLPEGYWIEYGGQFQSASSAMRTILLTLLISLGIIIAVLRYEYNNYMTSLLVLMCLPLSLVGGVGMLLLSGEVLNIPAIIGFISVFGIATRCGMLLMSEYEKQRHLIKETGEGDNYELIVKGTSARLNAIMMTTLSSALALLPLVWNADLPGNEIQGPMAKVILGGLISSTLLSLFVIPLIYHYYIEKK